MPSTYLVTDLSTGNSYDIHEIDQHYNFVTLDSVVQLDHYPSHGEDEEDWVLEPAAVACSIKDCKAVVKTHVPHCDFHHEV